MLMLALCLASCYNDADTSDESSDIQSEDASSAENTLLYNRTEIAKLLFNDKTVHMIFAGGYLNGGETCDGYTECDRNSEYAMFDSVKRLLSQTYDASSGVIEYYLDYPVYGKNAVTEGTDGKTLFYYHFIDDRDISVADFDVSDDGTVTVGDKTLRLIHTDDGLRLDGTLYDTVFNSPEGIYMDKGSASVLRGKYLAVAIMMSKDEYTLTDDDEKTFLNTLAGSLDTVSDMARQYGAEVEFDTSLIRFAHSDSFDGGFELDMMFAATSFHSLEGFISSQCDVDIYDGCFAVVYSADVQGVSYTAYCKGLPDANRCERIIVAPDSESNEIAAAVLALFGAEPADGLLFEYLGDDIMSGGDGLGVVNAYRVGLLDELNSQLCVFIK